MLIRQLTVELRVVSQDCTDSYQNRVVNFPEPVEPSLESALSGWVSWPVPSHPGRVRLTCG